MANKLQKYLESIDQAVQTIQFPSNPKGLYEPMHYLLNLGGKRIRPVLAFMGCELFQENYSVAKNAALAVELFHNFSLVHDDIMDKAPIRRGQETVHTKWNENTAILSGDALLIESYKLLCLYEPNLSQQLLTLFNKTASEVCEGQQNDMDFEKQKNVSIEEYLDMTRKKTAVLLGCSLKMGAMIGGASDKDANDLYAFGVNLGVAFQLQDDILDVYSDQAKFGKQVGGDIIANKKTYLLLRAYQDANAHQKLHLEKLLNETNASLKIKEVTALYNTLEVPEKAKKKMNAFYDLALTNLSHLNSAEEKKIPLKELAGFLMNRDV
jgi:geranylgeranyl diphosphate synthase, type II